MEVWTVEIFLKTELLEVAIQLGKDLTSRLQTQKRFKRKLTYLLPTTKHTYNNLICIVVHLI